MKLPSKELIEKVLNVNFRKNFSNINITKNKLSWQELIGINKWDTKTNTINIYEFAFKVKEWAITKNFRIYSRVDKKFKGKIDIHNPDVYPIINESFYADSEQEGIIKAGEWILKQIKDK